MSTKGANLEDTLHSAGHRVTEPRRLLLQIIREQGEHLDADELYRLARQNNPRISLSTVYRTMTLLRDLGLVDELHLGEDHHHYEIRRPGTHHHLICLSCGQVVEFSSPLADELKASVAQEYDFEIDQVQIDITGFCSDCRSLAEQAAEPAENT